MAVNYNPKIIIDGLIHYFNAVDPKSLSSNVWSSVVSNASVNTSATLVNGSLTQNGISTNTTYINSLSSYNAVTVVVSFTSNTTSKGTIFSVYGNTNFFFNPSDLASVSNTHTSFPDSTGTVALSAGFDSNSSLTFISNNYSAFPDAIGTYDMGSNLSSNSSLTFISNNYSAFPDAIGTYDMGSNLSSNSSLTDASLYGANTTVLSVDYYADMPDSDISFYIENDSLNGMYRSNGYSKITTSNFAPSVNRDMVGIVYKNNNNVDSGIKLYLNNTQIANSSNSSLFGSFGNNLSLLSRNGQLSAVNFPVKSIMIYNRELTESEIRQNYNALNGIKG